MANESWSSDASWKILFPALTVLAGIAVFIRPISSERPTASPGHREAIGYADVDARLWEDPFRAVDTVTPDPSQAGKQAGWDAFVAGFQARLRTSSMDGSPDADARVLVLPVMIPAAAYADLTEQRVRARTAVLSGLARCGYNPEDTTHIAFFRKSWDMRSLDIPDAADRVPANHREVVFPYEWLRPAAMPMSVFGVQTSPEPLPKYDRVLVLWLNEDLLTDRPLKRFDGLLRDIFGGVFGSKAAAPPPVPKRPPGDVAATARPATTTLSTATTGPDPADYPIDVTVIGPRTSTTLRAMVWDARRDAKLTLPVAVKFICPTATAEERALLDDDRPDAALRQTLAKDAIDADDLRGYLRGPGGKNNIEFYRIAATDREITATLADELTNRGIRLRPTTRPLPDGTSVRDYVETDHVAVIAEWDTFFGRALPLSFAATSSGQTVNDLARWQARFPSNIHPFVYLRGIDGQSAVDPDAAGRAKSDGEKKGDSRRPTEVPEGTNQSDGVRRLADQLVALDNELRYNDKRLRAVGVLGTDVYDKLMILLALRPKLPGVTFFTTDLDARYGMASQWQATHNLIVASGFGPRLHQYYQGGIPPFRDSNQTATFAATLTALGLVDLDLIAGRERTPATQPFAAPRLYEISRDGPYELSNDSVAVRNQPERIMGRQDRPLLTIHPPRENLRTLLDRSLSWNGKIFLSIAVMVATVIAWYWVNSDLGRKGRIKSFADGLISNPYLVVPAILVITTTGLWALHGWDGPQSEPFSLTNGISAWPTVAARLSALTLVFYFVRRAELERQTNDDDIRRKFAFAERERPHEPEPASATSDPLTADAEKIWNTYRWRGRLGRRLAISAILAVFFMAFSAGVQDCFGWPSSPIRGDVGRLFDHWGLRLLVTYVVLFYVTLVYQSAIINRKFINALAKGQTIYPHGAFEKVLEARIDNTAPATPETLSRRTSVVFLFTEWLDVQLIAKRTEIVGKSVYHAMLVFGLIAVSRTTLFDDWDWPPGLLIMFGLIGGAILLASVLLRSAAERARGQALGGLAERRFYHAGRGDSDHVGVIDDLIADIKNERRGAFAVFSQYPWLTAVLIPSGGIGLWALLEKLPLLLH